MARTEPFNYVWTMTDEKKVLGRIYPKILPPQIVPCLQSLPIFFTSTNAEALF